MAKTLEPMGKLDATSVVNGPEDGPCNWESVSWLSAEGNVRRLRQRIFTASQAGDLKRVRNLQKLMLRSRSSTLLSVRRVTELNAGRKTAGIDRERALTPQARADLADWVQHQVQPWKARPVKRVYIPKKGVTGKRRPLGIPVIADRVQQARVVNALEPEQGTGRCAASASAYAAGTWTSRKATWPPVGADNLVHVMRPADELDPVRLLVEVHEEVAGLLGGPFAGGLEGDAEDADAPDRVLDYGQDVGPGCR